jgi:acyltransferase
VPPSSPSPRLAYIDAARGLAILCVIFGHMLEMAGPFIQTPNAILAPNAILGEEVRFLYAFHVPFFFLLSGYVRSNRRESLHKAMKAGLELIALAYITHIIAVMIGLSLRHVALANVPALLIKPLTIGNGHMLVVMWFLVVLALTRIIFAALMPLSLHWRALIIALLCVLSLIVTAFEAVNIWYIKSWFAATLFYGLGLALPLTKPLLKQPFTIFLIAFLLLIASFGMNDQCRLGLGPFCALKNPPDLTHIAVVSGRYGDIVLFLMSAVAGSLALLALAVLLEKYMRAVTAFMAWFGRHSLNLLIINGFIFAFLPLAFSFLKPVMMSHGEAWLFSIALLIISIAAHAALVLMLQWPLEQLHKAAHFISAQGMKLLRYA